MEILQNTELFERLHYPYYNISHYRIRGTNFEYIPNMKCWYERVTEHTTACHYSFGQVFDSICENHTITDEFKIYILFNLSELTNLTNK